MDSKEQTQQLPAGKVISCPHEMAVRYRFANRPDESALNKIMDWLEERRETVGNFQWNEDGWTIKVYMKGNRTDWMTELSVDLCRYLQAQGFRA